MNAASIVAANVNLIDFFIVCPLLLTVVKFVRDRSYTSKKKYQQICQANLSAAIVAVNLL
jgi:hypothetical protein